MPELADHKKEAILRAGAGSRSAPQKTKAPVLPAPRRQRSLAISANFGDGRRELRAQRR